LSFGIQNRAIHQSTLEFDFCRTTDDQGQEPKNKRTGKNMSVLKQQIYFVAIHPKMQQKLLLHSGMITPNILV
jgi:hypothetical protein